MYENAQYIKSYGNLTGIRVIISGDISFVPLDPANTDYQNIMRLVESNQLTIADPE